MIDAFLAKLEKVRRTSATTWIARCPAHEDKAPSLGAKLADDGRVLVICRAGCSFEDIIGAVGMSVDEFFPPKLVGDRLPPIRRPFPAADVLDSLAHEALVVQLTASGLARGDVLTSERSARLLQAVSRIQTARDFTNG